MAPATIPTAIPSRLIAGDTWRWDRSVSGYSPADGWSLTTFFRGAGKLNVSGVANSGNNAWENTAALAATKTLAAGQYQWTEVVTNATERYVVGRGVLTVEPNPELQVAGEGTPWEETAVTKLKAFLAGSVEEGILEYQIAGRAVKLMSPDEALTLLDKLQGRLAVQRTRGRRPPIVPEFRRVG